MQVRGTSESSWITVLNAKEDLSRALVLAASLRRVLTNHKLTALVVGNDLLESIRQQLYNGGYDNVLAIEDGQKPIKETLSSVQLPKVNSCLYLPLDSIVLDNCDQLMSNQNAGEEFDKCSNGDAFWMSLGQGSKCALLEAPVYIKVGCSDSAKLQNSLDYVPAIVRLNGISVGNVKNFVNATSGLLEKKIQGYWQRIYNEDVASLLDTSEPKEKVTTWNGEPVAVVGTAECFSNAPLLQVFTEAVQTGLAEAGIDLSTEASSTHSAVLIGSCTAENPDAVEQLKKSLESSSLENQKLLAKIEFLSSSSCEHSPTSFTSLHTAINRLNQYEHNNHLCLAFFIDEKNRVSLLVLKRLSQALKSDDKILAIMGNCTTQVKLWKKLAISTEEKSESDDDYSDILDIVEIVRFINLKGPIVNKPWLKFAKINESDRKESAFIKKIGQLAGTPGMFVVSTCHANLFKKNYPSFVLNMERPLHCIALETSSQQKMDEMLGNNENLLTKVKINEDSPSLADLAYTTNISCATQQNFRAMIIAKDYDEARKQIAAKSYLKEDSKSNSSPAKSQKLCFLFTGQGSQYAGMAKSLYENCPMFRLSFDRCNHLFRNLYNIDLHDVIWKNSTELSRTLFSQTAIFCIEYALLQVWKSWGIEPDCVIGHSLGEFGAAVAAGALELEDALMLVAERSRLIDNLPRGKMLVIRGDEITVEQLVREYSRNNPGAWVDFAAVNSKDQTVLSGDSKYIEQFSEFCKKRNVTNMVLEATHAFHSRHMDPMLDAYRNVAKTCKGALIPSKCVYISGVEGKVIKGQLDPDYWVKHTRERVRFVQASRTAYQQGCTVFLEVGPQPILSTFVKVNSAVKTLTFLPSIRRGVDDWKTILNSLAKLWLGGRNVNWKGFDKYFDRKRLEDVSLEE